MGGLTRVLIDQGLAPGVAHILNSQGWDVVHVSEIGLAAADDREILDFAAASGRVCVTLDHDFHTHLALARATGPSVVFVRREGIGAMVQAGIIAEVWKRYARELAEGAAISVSSTSVRVRRLPLR